MPRGPFSPVEQAPIEGVKLVAEKLPVSQAEAGVGIAQAVGGAAKDLVNVQKERFQKQIETDAQKELSAVTEGLMAIRDPEAQDRLFAAASSGNPFFMRAREEFDAINLAVKQGKLPSDAAAVRMRAVMKTAINEAPEFTEELRAAARQSVGFSPEAEVVKDLLREPVAGPKTAVDKKREEIAAMVQVLGIKEEVAVAGLRNKQLAEFELSVLSVQSKQGEVSANHAAAIADASIASFSTDFMAQMQATVIQQGGIKDTASAKVAVSQMLSTFKQQALASAGPNAPIDSRGRITQRFRDEEQSLHNMIDDGSLEQMFTQNNDLLQAQTLNGVLSIPELAVMHQFGKDKLLDYLAVSSKYTTPAQIEAAMQFHPALAGIKTLKELQPALFGAVTRQENGQELSTRDKILAGMYNTQVMTNKDSTPEARTEALERQKANLGNASTFRQFEDAQMLVRTKQDSAMASSFAELFATQQSGNVAEMQQILREFPDTVFVDGQYKQPAPSGLDAAQGGMAFSMPDQGALQRVNRMLRIGKQYSEAGIIKWEGADAFHASVVARDEGVSAGLNDITENARAGGFSATQDGRYAHPDGRVIIVKDGKVFMEK